MPFFKTHRGLNWHYEVSGAGETIVMIHGLGASGNIWQAQKDFLQTDFQVVTLDLPGHGKSGWMPVTLIDMAIDIRQILNNAWDCPSFHWLPHPWEVWWPWSFTA